MVTELQMKNKRPVKFHPLFADFLLRSNKETGFNLCIVEYDCYLHLELPSPG